MTKFVQFTGFVDGEVRVFGRIVCIDGKLRAEGRLMEKLLGERIRDLTPEGSQEWLTKDKPERYLEALPYVYHGCRLCGSLVQEE